MVNNDSDKSLSQMLEDGEIDAILSAMMPESFGCNPDIVRLFPNFREVEADYYRHEALSLMHLVVIRRIHDTNPEVVQSLYDATIGPKISRWNISTPARYGTCYPSAPT